MGEADDATVFRTIALARARLHLRQLRRQRRTVQLRRLQLHALLFLYAPCLAWDHWVPTRLQPLRDRLAAESHLVDELAGQLGRAAKLGRRVMRDVRRGDLSHAEELQVAMAETAASIRQLSRWIRFLTPAGGGG